MRSAADWLASLSPWPREFRLDRMRALLGALGDPHRAFRAVHVVGTNGKSTATLTIEALLAAEGLHVGATISPHVRSWSERIRVDGAEADFERTIAAVRPAVERIGATQFEAVTAAAFREFARAGVDAAVVEAGLGGRLDATNVIDAPVVLLTNVELEHTGVLGSTRGAIAREKLAVVASGTTVVLPDLEFASLVPHAQVVVGGAREAAEAFVGRPVERAVDVSLPGRFEVRCERPLEIWDGAHNPAGVDHLVARLPRGRKFVLVASILADKDARRMLMTLYPCATRLIATQSSNPRSWAATELASIAGDLGEYHRYRSIESIADPRKALRRARELAGPEGAVLVTGSLYLLADLFAAEEQERCTASASG